MRRTKDNLKKWGLLEWTSTTCECGMEQIMKHNIMQCLIYPYSCTHEDVINVKGNAKDVVRFWAEAIWVQKATIYFRYLFLTFKLFIYMFVYFYCELIYILYKIIVPMCGVLDMRKKLNWLIILCYLNDFIDQVLISKSIINGKIFVLI